MPLLRNGHRAALPLLALLSIAPLVACTGGTDEAATPSQGRAEGTYLHATITLLDDFADPCRPGVLCNPEFFDCEGTLGFTVPMSWTMRADLVSAGAINYTPGGTIVTLALRGTDAARDTAVSLGLQVTVNPGGAYTALVGGSPEATFANVEASCTLVNASLDPVTQFALIGSPAPSVALTEFPLTTSGEVDLASPDGAGLTARYIEGTFAFTAQTRQVFGQTYIADVLVQGCFRLQLPGHEQGVPVDPSATPPCS